MRHVIRLARGLRTGGRAMKTLHALLAKSTSWNRQGLYVRRGWRFGLGVGAPLFVGVATGLPVEGVTVCVGALLVGLTDSGDPYRRRMPQMLVASAWVGTCTFVGELVGAHAALTVLVLAIASFAAGICIAAGLTAYLIAVMGPLGMVFATGAPTSPVAALGHGALAALGGLIEVALVLMAWRSHPDLPERIATARLYRAIANWLTEDDRSDDRAPVFLARQRARAVLGDDDIAQPPPDDAGCTAALRALVAVGERIFRELATLRRAFEGVDDVDGQLGRYRTAIADALTLVADRVQRPPRQDAPAAPSRNPSDPSDPSDPCDPSDNGRPLAASAPTGLTASGWARTVALEDRVIEALALSATIGAHHAALRPTRLRRGHWRRRARSALRGFAQAIRTGLTAGSSALRHAIRLAVTVAAAAALEVALHFPNGYWAPLTVLWLLRPDFGTTFTRGFQRYAGTAAGAVLATLIAATLHPGPYAVAVAATVFAAGISAFMLANYAITSLFITGWVVFATCLAGVPELNAAVDRVIETTIGAALTLGFYLIWPTWERSAAAAAVADVVEVDRRYAEAVLSSWLDRGSDRATIDRVRAESRLTRTDTEAMLARARAEPGRFDFGLVTDVLANMRRFCDGPLALEAQLDEIAAPCPPTAATFAAQIDVALTDLTGAVRSGGGRVELESLREAWGALHSELATTDPLRSAAELMVDAIAGAAAAVVRTRDTGEPNARATDAAVGGAA
jgi:hypothetical protein